MTTRRDLGDFGERVAAAHLGAVPVPTVETVGFASSKLRVSTRGNRHRKIGAAHDHPSRPW